MVDPFPLLHRASSALRRQERPWEGRKPRLLDDAWIASLDALLDEHGGVLRLSNDYPITIARNQPREGRR